MTEASAASRQIVACPQCGAKYDTTRVRAGARVKCQKCGAMVQTPGDALVGRTIAGYHIHEKIGEGGMGAVYLAEQVSLKRKVAFKALKGSKVQDQQAIEDFHREAISAARLTHANIVQIYDISVAEGITFMTMEYVDGVTLQELLDRQGRFQPPEAVSVAVQVLQGLGRAHREGIIHRDIKPGNVMLDREGNVKVTDFGLAKMLAEQPAADEKRRGTVLYMAPEQIRSPNVDCRADLYALGATLFHMLTGRPPFKGETAKETLDLVATAPVPDPCEAAPAVPRELGDVTMRLLAKDPKERYGTAQEVLQALESAAPQAAGGAFAGDQWRDLYRDVYAATGGLSRHAALERGGGLMNAAIYVLMVLVVLSTVAVIYTLVRRQSAQPQALAGAGQAGGVRPVPADDRAAKLEGMFRFAETYEKEHPDDFAQIVANYAQVIEAGRGTDYVLRAQTRLAAVRKQQTEAVEKEFEGVKGEARRLAEGLEFVKALEMVDGWAARRNEAAFDSRLADLREDVRGRARAEVSAVAGQAESAIKDDDFDKAAAILKRLRSWGVQEAIEAAAKAEAEMARRLKQAEAEWRVQAIAGHVELLQAVHRATTRDRDFDEAISLCAKAAADPKLKSIRASLMEEIQDLKSARDIQETALKALKEGKVITVRIRGIQYKFKGLRGDEISLEGPGGQEQKASLSKLSEKDIAGFAEAALEPLDADKELRIAVFHIYTGGLREARTRLESLERRNVEIPERMKKRLEILRLGWTYAERDARAAQMLTRMRQAYEAREWDAVNQLLAGLKEYADCGVVAEAKEEIDKIRATAQVAPRRWTPPAPQPPRRDFIKRTDPTTPPPDRLRRE